MKRVMLVFGALLTFALLPLFNMQPNLGTYLVLGICVTIFGYAVTLKS